MTYGPNRSDGRKVRRAARRRVCCRWVSGSRVPEVASSVDVPPARTESQFEGWAEIECSEHVEKTRRLASQSESGTIRTCHLALPMIQVDRLTRGAG